MKYAFQQAFRAIRYNWIASMSTITTMILSLTILAGFSLLGLNLNLLLGELKSELELAAYLTPETNEHDVIAQINSWPEVAYSELILPDAALNALMGDVSYLNQVANLVANPLPATIEMRLYNPADTPTVAARLRQLPDVTNIEDGSEAAATFIAIRDAFRWIGWVIIIVLLTAALFAMVNTIRVAINTRKDEIEVMRLVGATRSFIRAPFLIEGLLLGFISAVVSISLMFVSYHFSIVRVSTYVPLIPFLKDPKVLTQVGLLLFCLALIVGFVGSTISVAQYLQEEM